jgi:hypothetical protein
VLLPAPPSFIRVKIMDISSIKRAVTWISIGAAVLSLIAFSGVGVYQLATGTGAVPAR